MIPAPKYPASWSPNAKREQTSEATAPENPQSTTRRKAAGSKSVSPEAIARKIVKAVKSPGYFRTNGTSRRSGFALRAFSRCARSRWSSDAKDEPRSASVRSLGVCPLDPLDEFCAMVYPHFDCCPSVSCNRCGYSRQYSAGQYWRPNLPEPLVSFFVRRIVSHSIGNELKLAADCDFGNRLSYNTASPAMPDIVIRPPSAFLIFHGFLKLRPQFRGFFCDIVFALNPYTAFGAFRGERFGRGGQCFAHGRDQRLLRPRRNDPAATLIHQLGCRQCRSKSPDGPTPVLP